VPLNSKRVATCLCRRAGVTATKGKDARNKLCSSLRRSVAILSDLMSEGIVKYLASKDLHYEDGKRTTTPIRILSADMVLRGIATQAQLEWPTRTKKELVLVLMNRASTGLLDVNKIKSHDHFRANDWSNLAAAREARAVGDQKRTAASLALMDEYEKKHETLTDPATIRKRKARDEADLAKGMSQENIDARNQAARAQQASHIKKKIRAELAGVPVNKLKSIELMLAEKSGTVNTALWRKLEMPDEKPKKKLLRRSLKEFPE
jgi:hypothetical protein